MRAVATHLALAHLLGKRANSCLPPATLPCLMSLKVLDAVTLMIGFNFNESVRWVYIFRVFQVLHHV